MYDARHPLVRDIYDSWHPFFFQLHTMLCMLLKQNVLYSRRTGMYSGLSADAVCKRSASADQVLHTGGYTEPLVIAERVEGNVCIGTLMMTCHSRCQQS